MVRDEFMNALRKHGIEPVESIGVPSIRRCTTHCSKSTRPTIRAWSFASSSAATSSVMAAAARENDHRGPGSTGKA